MLSHNCDWSAIRLVGETGKEMFASAKSFLLKNGGSAEELAKGFQSFAAQINKRDPSWSATMSRGADGSYVFTGEARPFVFVISPEGKLFQHHNITQVSTFVNGVAKPIYDKMTRIQ